MRNLGAKIGKTLIHLALDLWVAIVCIIVWSVGLALTVGLAVTVVGGAVALAATLAVCMAIGSLERARAAAFLGVEIPSPRLVPVGAKPRYGVLGRYVSSQSAWNALGYVFIKSITGIVSFAAAITVWSLGFAFLLWPLVRPLVPSQRSAGYLEVATTGRALGVLLLGAVLLVVVAPAVTLLLGALNAQLVAALLGAGREDELKAKVAEETTRRNAAVEGAEAERRRIERDLHDGAQQRLVALGMTLGLAKEKLDSDPEQARQLMNEAHAEAKAAMTELRSIARGIHPAVLEDRGLDAALSSIAALAPIPVRIRVQLPERLGPTIEGAAYYVVSEALTNIAKHAHATEATVTIEVRPRNNRPYVVVTVVDDGSGGAGIVANGGLSGLQDRVAALSGTLSIDSPNYGPTTLIAEIPRWT